MASDMHPHDHWDRVASELRAYREAQQQAWGEIDNATLGRFLAGEVSAAERQRIEDTFDEHPELRKLTDLVRDVLADFEPTVGHALAPRAPVQAPRILPFPHRQHARPSIVRWVRQRSALLAAACVLLALSSGLFNSRVSQAIFEEDLSNTVSGSDATAMVMPLEMMGPERFHAVVVRSNKPVEATLHLQMQSLVDTRSNSQSTPSLARLEILNEKIDGLREQDKLEEALTLSETATTVAKRANLEQHPVYAATQERKARILQKQGDLDRACTSLCEAYDIRKKELGPQNKETAKTAYSLADMYATAINTSNYGSANSFVYTPAAAPYHLDRLHHQDAAAVKREVVPVMLQGLQNAATEKEREQLVIALGHLGAKAAEAVPVLAGRLHKAQAADKHPMMTMKVVGATQPTTEGTLGNRERCALLWALGQMGPEAHEAVPVLLEALKSNSPDVRRCATTAIVKVHRDLLGIVAGCSATHVSD